MADTTQLSSELDATISALQQGLTAIPADQAVAVISSWQQKLQGTDLAEDLGELKTALSNGGTGASIGQILTDLGEDTTETASGASGEIAQKLQQLGSLLKQAGGSLS
jgi:hypothetical protein